MVVSGNIFLFSKTGGKTFMKKIFMGMIFFVLSVMFSYAMAFGRDRQIYAEDIVVPTGLKIEAWATGLSYPVDITFDDQGNAYVAEAGGQTYGTSPDKATPAQIVKFSADGKKKQVVLEKTVFFLWM